MSNKIESVGVLGAGQMGLGIAQVTAQAGVRTTLVKATPGDTGKLRERVEAAYGRDVEKRVAWETWARTLTAILERKPGADVVPIRRGAR